MWKRTVPRVYTEIKVKDNLIEWTKIWADTSKKNIYKWQIRKWKGSLSGQCQLKPQWNSQSNLLPRGVTSCAMRKNTLKRMIQPNGDLKKSELLMSK